MKRVVVIGLGTFGFHLVKSLFENGVEVIAIDRDKEVVQKIRDYATKAILADGTDKELMESIGIQEEDVVVVSFGEDLAAAALVTLHLKELNVKQIIVKTPDEEHKRVLERLGATEVLIPEKEMADKIARSLISPNVLDFIPISKEFTVSEVASPPDFHGKTLGQLHLRSKYHIEVIAVKEVLSDRVVMIPRADYVIKDSDLLVVIGRPEDIEKLG